MKPMGKLKSIFEPAENFSLVLTKLDTELGLTQPQLVVSIHNSITSEEYHIILVYCHLMYYGYLDMFDIIIFETLAPKARPRTHL